MPYPQASVLQSFARRTYQFLIVTEMLKGCVRARFKAASNGVTFA